MKKMTSEQVAKYHKSREKGYLRFVFTRGILMWGLPLGLGFALYKYFFQDDKTAWTITLPIWVFAGILFGTIMWHAERSMVYKHIQKDNSNPPS